MLVVFTTGCTRYRSATLPGGDPHPTTVKSAGEVRPGWDIRVLLRSGETLSGRVVRVESNALYFDRSGNYGYKEQRVLFRDVESIEKKVVVLTMGWVFGPMLGILVIVGFIQSFPGA